MTIVDHRQPLPTMVKPWLAMVESGLRLAMVDKEGDPGQPLLTRVNHGEHYG